MYKPAAHSRGIQQNIGPDRAVDDWTGGLLKYCVKSVSIQTIPNFKQSIPAWWTVDLSNRKKWIQFVVTFVKVYFNKDSIKGMAVLFISLHIYIIISAMVPTDPLKVLKSLIFFKALKKY